SFSSRRRHTRFSRDWSSDVCSSDLEGATLYTNGAETHIEPVKAEQVVDPTGCGDAHRAGLLYGLTQSWSLVDACRLANVMGSFRSEERRVGKEGRCVWSRGR